jgi:hypothetical protein
MKKDKKPLIYLGIGIALLTMDLSGVNIGAALPIGLILIVEAIDRL